VIFVAEKRLQQPDIGLLQLFAVVVSVGVTPSVQITRTVTARKPTEYCLSMRFGDPVKIRNNRPLL